MHFETIKMFGLLFREGYKGGGLILLIILIIRMWEKSKVSFFLYNLLRRMFDSFLYICKNLVAL